MGTFGADANGEATSGMNYESESTNAASRGGTPHSSDEVGESRWSEGGVCSEATSVGPTRKGRSLKDEAKPFCISRWEVWEAYLKVKSNQGAAGLDGQTIADFERGLKKNLYRIWNRMSSGSYFPPPVRTVKIPKANGGERTLGIPTVSDRIAQMVVKNRLEAVVDPLFLPAQDEAGNLLQRDKGTPQGGVISPLLANLFLHYAFDLWMRRNWTHLPFERYADDIIVHCRTEREANLVRVKIAARLKQCGLELHPEKTKVVNCKDANRQGTHPNEKFDFLGFTFRPRAAYGRKGKIFCSFSPAISNKAGQKIRDEIRGWKLHRCTGQTLQELARKINPKLRGWFNYYGRFTRSALRPIERHVGQSLVRWACRKYTKLRNHRSQAWSWLMGVLDRQPDLLALWEHQRSRFITIGAV